MHDAAWAAGPTPRHPSLDEDQSDKYRDLGTPYTPADTPGGGIVSTPGLDAGNFARPETLLRKACHFLKPAERYGGVV